MPMRSDIAPVHLPMAIRFDEEPTTEFKNSLDALTVSLLDAPNPDTIRRTVHAFVRSTWADHPPGTGRFLEAQTGNRDPRVVSRTTDGVSEAELRRAMEDVFCGRALPAAQELIGLTFLVGGIDLQTVTHIVRHRAGTFAAQCTGDRFLHHEAALVPSSVEDSPEFVDRWRRHVDEGKRLYADMVTSRKVSMMDARTVLPKCLETFYLMRMNAGEWIRFINQRRDGQIQPEVDNLLALRVAVALVGQFPEAAGAIKLRDPDFHYINTFRNGTGTNLYRPEPKNDRFDFHPDDTLYAGTREDIRGTQPRGGRSHFAELWEVGMAEYDALTAIHRPQVGLG